MADDLFCPVVAPGIVACYNGCDVCIPMPALWYVDLGGEYEELFSTWMHQEGGCSFSNSCYLDCEACPKGTAWAWYVTDLECLLPIPAGVMIPEGGCSWTNCCPNTAIPPH